MNYKNEISWLHWIDTMMATFNLDGNDIVNGWYINNWDGIIQKSMSIILLKLWTVLKKGIVYNHKVINLL